MSQRNIELEYVDDRGILKLRRPNSGLRVRHGSRTRDQVFEVSASKM
jgi:hypothetical protein